VSEIDPAQAAVVTLLGDPATFGLSVEDVKRIDTHGAYVFLAGERAYKIKRAVKYPYLDYSTLERREAACRTELEVNRHFAPELYLGVVPIMRRSGRLALGGEGEPVEWAVEMRRFRETLEEAAKRDGIDDALARALGEAVAVAHQTLPLVEAKLWIDALGKYVDDAAEAFAGAPDVVASKDGAALIEVLRASLGHNRQLLSMRGKAGFVRRGHGDLHLRNVAVIAGRPVLFDAIEFDPLIASGDVLYDLAFLLMDLVDRKFERAANIVFNRYLLAAGMEEHLDALAALPFFLVLRATIRARVALDKRKLVSGKERAVAEDEAREYRALAAHLIAPPKPRLVAVGGLSGTGKSVLASSLAPFLQPAPGAVHLRSDIERKRLFGIAETERLPEAAYAQDVTAKVYSRLADLARRTLHAGHCAIVDAVHARPQEREALEAVAKEAGVKFDGIWLDAALDTRVARVGARVADASDADAKIVREQEKFDEGRVAWTKVEAGGALAEVTAAVRRELNL
jgi:aminoglycoside phosphotransferase family enzyme/predicted kinase